MWCCPLHPAQAAPMGTEGSPRGQQHQTPRPQGQVGQTPRPLSDPHAGGMALLCWANPPTRTFLSVASKRSAPLVRLLTVSGGAAQSVACLSGGAQPSPPGSSRELRGYTGGGGWGWLARASGSRCPQLRAGMGPAMQDPLLEAGESGLTGGAPRPFHPWLLYVGQEPPAGPGPQQGWGKGGMGCH